MTAHVYEDWQTDLPRCPLCMNRMPASYGLITRNGDLVWACASCYLDFEPYTAATQ